MLQIYDELPGVIVQNRPLSGNPNNDTVIAVLMVTCWLLPLGPYRERVTRDSSTQGHHRTQHTDNDAEPFVDSQRMILLM